MHYPFETLWNSLPPLMFGRKLSLKSRNIGFQVVYFIDGKACPPCKSPGWVFDRREVCAFCSAQIRGVCECTCAKTSHWFFSFMKLWDERGHGHARFPVSHGVCACRNHGSCCRTRGSRTGSTETGRCVWLCWRCVALRVSTCVFATLWCILPWTAF